MFDGFRLKKPEDMPRAVAAVDPVDGGQEAAPPALPPSAGNHDANDAEEGCSPSARVHIVGVLVHEREAHDLVSPPEGRRVSGKDRVLEQIQMINAQGVTIFMVEQNANLALQIAHRGYALQNGRIVLEGPAQTLLDSPQIQDAYLGESEQARHTND